MPALISRMSAPRQLRCTAVYSDSLVENTVSLSRDLFASLSSDSDSSGSRYVVIHTMASKKWVLYKVMNYPDPGNFTNVCLISNQNKLHGGPPPNSTILIQPVTPVTLTNVIISCPSDIYDQVNKLSQDELTSNLLRQQGNLIRQGDYCYYLGGSFILSEPVDQGLLSHSTKITIIKNHEEKGIPELENDVNLEVEIEKYLNSTVIQEDFVPVTLQVLPLVEPINLQISIPKQKDDPESRAYVGFELLANIGCFSGDIVCFLFSIVLKKKRY